MRITSAGIKADDGQWLTSNHAHIYAAIGDRCVTNAATLPDGTRHVHTFKLGDTRTEPAGGPDYPHYHNVPEDSHGS